MILLFPAAISTTRRVIKELYLDEDAVVGFWENEPPPTHNGLPMNCSSLHGPCICFSGHSRSMTPSTVSRLSSISGPPPPPCRQRDASPMETYGNLQNDLQAFLCPPESSSSIGRPRRRQSQGEVDAGSTLTRNSPWWEENKSTRDLIRDSARLLGIWSKSAFDKFCERFKSANHLLISE